MSAFQDLGGKRVFISGAASGIGYAMSLAFAGEGADIVATDIREDGLAELASNIGAAGGNCRAFLAARGNSDRPALLVNLASAASFAPQPNMSAYAASKYAVEGLSEVLAMELEGTPVDVLCVHPGVINTSIVNHPELCLMEDEQLQRLQAYYAEHGALPAEVARDVIAGVKSGSGNVYTGPGMTSTTLLKRMLPRRWFRRLLMSKAREIGYL